MDKLSPDDPMLEMRQTLHDTSLENTALRQRVEALERAAAECAEAYRDILGFGPSTKLELLLAAQDNARLAEAR